MRRLQPLIVTAAIILSCSVVTSWVTQCPRECKCYMSPLSSLSFAKWIDDISIANQSDTDVDETYLYNNDLSLDGDWSKGSQGKLLKTAVCIVMKSPDPLIMLNLIPNDVEALSILQSPGSGIVTLKKEHFQPFTRLLSLELQGYKSLREQSGVENNKYPTSEDSDDSATSLKVTEGSLQVLKTLQLLNLQFLSFERDQTKSNLTSPDPNSFYHHNDISDSPILHEIVFIQPDEEIVPYEIYKEKQLKSDEKHPWKLFSNITSLRYLRAHDCSLNTLNWEMFDGLSHLQLLMLDQNNIRYLPDFVFYGVPNVKVLSLGHNAILNVESAGLAGLLKLEKLYFSYNNISHLSELSLPPFPDLELADFQGNPIKAIFPNTFEIMNTTRAIYMGSKDITLEFYSASFTGLDDLESLTITNVTVDLLQREMLVGIPKLKDLILHGKIRKLNFDAFLETPKLQTLVLSKCEMKKISMDAFVGLMQLSRLDLSHNEIEKLPLGIFDDLTSLRELWLQNNRLATLPKGIFRNLPAKLIRLQRNPWHCSCDFSDWKSTAINKVKEHVGKRTFCQVHPLTEKPVCFNRSEYQYSYSKRVSPTCVTPKKFRNWSVFDAMRRELRCNKPKKMEDNKVPKEMKKIKKEKKIVEAIKQPTEQSVTGQPDENHLKEQNSGNDYKTFELNEAKQSEISHAEKTHKTKKSKHPPISKKAQKLEQERRRARKQKRHLNNQ